MSRLEVPAALLLPDDIQSPPPPQKKRTKRYANAHAYKRQKKLANNNTEDTSSSVQQVIENDLRSDYSEYTFFVASTNLSRIVKLLNAVTRHNLYLPLYVTKTGIYTTDKDDMEVYMYTFCLEKQGFQVFEFNGYDPVTIRDKQPHLLSDDALVDYDQSDYVYVPMVNPDLQNCFKGTNMFDTLILYQKKDQVDSIHIKLLNSRNNSSCQHRIGLLSVSETVTELYDYEIKNVVEVPIDIFSNAVRHLKGVSGPKGTWKVDMTLRVKGDKINGVPNQTLFPSIVLQIDKNTIVSEFEVASLLFVHPNSHYNVFDSWSTEDMDRLSYVALEEKLQSNLSETQISAWREYCLQSDGICFPTTLHLLSKVLGSLADSIVYVYFTNNQLIIGHHCLLLGHFNAHLSKYVAVDPQVIPDQTTTDQIDTNGLSSSLSGNNDNVSPPPPTIVVTKPTDSNLEVEGSDTNQLGLSPDTTTTTAQEQTATKLHANTSENPECDTHTNHLPIQHTTTTTCPTTTTTTSDTTTTTCPDTEQSKEHTNEKEVVVCTMEGSDMSDYDKAYFQERESDSDQDIWD